MKFRWGDESGTEVPALAQSLQDLQTSLAEKQALWAEQIARDPASFPQLEPQIHRTFQELADRCAASLLVHSSSQPACAEAAQKK